jgi:hypothetical protein
MRLRSGNVAAGADDERQILMNLLLIAVVTLTLSVWIWRRPVP